MWPLTLREWADDKTFRLGQKTMVLVKLEIANRSKKLLLKFVSYKTAIAADQSYLFLQEFN